MYKTFSLLSIALFFQLGIFGQAQLGRIEYQKKDRQAIVLYTQYPDEIVEGAIKDRMEKLGNKGKENKGLINLARNNFISFKGAVVPELGKASHDLYFKVERKSRKEADQSILYLVIGKGPNDFVSSTTDPKLMDDAKSFLNDLLPHIVAYNLEVEISTQEALLGKINDKIAGLENDSVNLDKRMQALQDKLNQNSNDRKEQVAELEKQRQILEAMKAKRKS